MRSLRKKGRAVLYFLLAVLLAALLLPVGLNAVVIFIASRYFYDCSDRKALSGLDADCVLVLGAWVNPDGTLSNMLRDRVDVGVNVFRQGAGRKLLMSGDHGRADYDEVNAMKAYALAHGIAREDVFMDHAGFSTYESMYRARQVYHAKKVVIVTQRYHLYRAVYIARALGLQAYGVPSDLRRYEDGFLNQCREFLARVKDFGLCIVKPRPALLGESFPLSGNGTATDDKTAY